MRISDWSSDVCSSDLKTRPRQVVGQLHLRAAVLGQAHHGAQSRNGRCFTWRANTSTNCGSSLAPHTASAWPTIHSTTPGSRSEEHTSELQSLMRISYAVFCLKTNTQLQIHILS